MIDLEKLARRKFQEYAYKQTNMSIDWRYLSEARKLAWMVELASMYFMCIEELEKELALEPPKSRPTASWERGFADGESHENARLRSHLDALKANIASQVEEHVDNRE